MTPLQAALVYRGLPINHPHPCECADTGCPAHFGLPHCERRANAVLFRTDMEDKTGSLFCERCALDAYGSGVYSDEPIEGGEA